MNTETKHHIDAARQVLVGVVPNPTSQIDQITNALIYKFMDDMDQSAIKQGGDPSFFIKDLKNYAWTRLMDSRIGNQERMNIYSEALVKFSESKQLPQLFREIFKSAFLPYRSPEVLGLFLKEINYFDYSHPEELGNAYEYLLSVMGSQGDAGQFRTPRHIIDFMVDAVDPNVDDKVLDPACGTGGFLVSAYKHILEQHDGKNSDGTKNKEKPLTPDQRKNLVGNFEGYDIDPGMVRIAQVNMYLHQFKNPKIYNYNTLADEEKWNDKFSVILANPPFMSPKGGVSTHSKFSIQSSRSEVLFVDYIMNHLKPQGRAGVIVPEGIIFQSGGAHKQLRKNLVEDGLYAVVSLPQGVFNPYAGVKTSILFFNNELAKKVKEILFVKVENDGLDLGATKRPIDKNDLPEALSILNRWKEGKKTESKISLYVEKSKIAEDGDYNLSVDRYRIGTDYSNAKWPIVELGEFIEFEDKSKRKSGDGKENGLYKFFVSSQEQNKFIDESDYQNENLILGTGGNVSVHIARNFSTSADTFVFHSKGNRLNNLYLYYLLFNNKEILKNGFRGQGIKHLSKEYLLKIKIPLPPIEIQEQTVKELNGYQNIITGAKQVINGWKPIVNINSLWEKDKIENLLKRVSEQVDPNNKTGEVFYVGLENIESDSGMIAGDTITKYGDIKSLKNIFKKGDILYGKLRPNLNKVWLANCDGICSTDILVFRATDKTIANFYWYLMLSENFVSEVMAGIKGAQLPRVGFEHLKNLILPFPSLEIQKQIVDRIESERTLVEGNKKLIEIYEQKTKEALAKLWEE